MALQVKQTLQQRLVMAPNLTVALEILRMPMLELQVFLRQQTEENPLLELEELAEEQEPTETSQEIEDYWSSHHSGISERENFDNDDNREQDGADMRFVQNETLHGSLRIQLGCQHISIEMRQWGEVLIDRLSENGYLEDSLEIIAAELNVPIAKLSEALIQIQRLDPPGVGARNLRECLMLQLERNEETKSLAYRILKDHFDLFVEYRPATMARKTKTTVASIEAACECLKKLNPKPGRAFVGELPPSIIPDLVVHKREEHYDVELNDESMPHPRINQRYQRMLRDSTTPMEVKEFLRERFRKASWVIKAIEERNATLLAIARCLISLQRNFIEEGIKAIQPLTQVQVADLIGRHASTVSRAITGKTIDTPSGVYRLEDLFASAVVQRAGSKDVSDEAIKSEIEQLIKKEDIKRPLSDAALVKQLSERQITVARRTIAKYRTHLKILPAYLRRRRRF